MAWTEAEKKQVVDLWNEGKTAREIAAILPGDKSRNAVIGQLHRMKAPKRPVMKKPISEKPRTATLPAKAKNAFVIRKTAHKNRVAPTPVDAPISVQTGEGVVLNDLRSRHCRNIIGYNDGDMAKAIYCGEQKYNNTSYCEYHAQINHLPPRVR